MKQSYWIWNYGDYEIYHSNKVNSRREQLGVNIPCFWRLYDVDRNVRFFYDVETEDDCEITLYVKGMGFIYVDNITRYQSDKPFTLKKGKHTLMICVTNLTGLPAAFIESDVIVTDSNWYTKTTDGNKQAVGFEKVYDTPASDPQVFPFEYEHIEPVSATEINDGVLFDFGKEYFGYLHVSNVTPEQNLHISYGESEEEALDTEFSILFEKVSGKNEYTLRQRAFRYIFVTGSKSVNVAADFEYLPLDFKGSFHCDNEDINKIWDISAYTLKLTAREVMLEAVKRDGWLWGGDAYQAYKFCNYLFFDKEIIRRSTIALRGKEPFCEHINTIIDYSFYWVIGLEEYYLYYKDTEFLKFIYPRAKTLMEFSVKRVNQEGFIIRKSGDWLFIDWSEIDKKGAVAAEQMLFIAANKAMAHISEILGYDGEEYVQTAKELTVKVNEFFWNDSLGAYIDSYESGKNHVTRHANIFAIMYDIADEAKKASIIRNVLRNDNITQITTPYFEGYELDTFGKIGDCDYIENKLKTYWKGMLDLGATTVWEEYNPEMSGIEHYEMYGGKYEKSLCHAWGAAPIYLLGKYFLGVSPTTDGFETFTVKPHLGSFKFIDGTVPILDGEVRVYLSNEKLSVTATKNGGTLLWDGKEYKLVANEEFLLEF